MANRKYFVEAAFQSGAGTPSGAGSNARIREAKYMVPQQQNSGQLPSLGAPPKIYQQAASPQNTLNRELLEDGFLGPNLQEDAAHNHRSMDSFVNETTRSGTSTIGSSSRRGKRKQSPGDVAQQLLSLAKHKRRTGSSKQQRINHGKDLYLDLIQNEDITHEDLQNDRNTTESSKLLERRAASTMIPRQVSKTTRSTSVGIPQLPSRLAAKSVSPSVMTRVQQRSGRMQSPSPLHMNGKRTSIASTTSGKSGSASYRDDTGRRKKNATPKRLAPLTPSRHASTKGTSPSLGRNHRRPLSNSAHALNDDNSSRHHLSPLSPHDDSPYQNAVSPRLITKPKKSLPANYEEHNSMSPSNYQDNHSTHSEPMLSPSMVSIASLSSPAAVGVNSTPFSHNAHASAPQSGTHSHNSSFSTLPSFRQSSAQPNRFRGFSPSSRLSTILPHPIDYSRSTTHAYRHFITQFHEKFLPFQGPLKHSLYSILQEIMQHHDSYLRDDKSNDEQLKQIEQFLSEYRTELMVEGDGDGSEALYVLICSIVDLLPLPHIVNILESRKKRLSGSSEPLRQHQREQGQPDLPFVSFHNFDPAGKDSVLFFALCCQAFVEPNVVARSPLCMKYMVNCIQFDDHPHVKPQQDATLDTTTIPLQPLSIDHMFFLLTSFHMLLLSMMESSQQYEKDIEFTLFPKCVRIIISSSNQTSASSDYLLLRPVLSILYILFDHFEMYRCTYLRNDPHLHHLLRLVQSHGSGQSNTHSQMMCILSTQKLVFKVLFRYMKDTDTLSGGASQNGQCNKRMRQQQQRSIYLSIVKSLLERTQHFLYNFCNVGVSGASGAHSQLSSKLASEIIVQSIWNTSDDFLVALLGFLQDMLSILYDSTFVIPVPLSGGISPTRKHADVQRLQPSNEVSQLQTLILNNLHPANIMVALIGISQVSRRALLAFQRELNENEKDEDVYDEDDQSDLFGDGGQGHNSQFGGLQEGDSETSHQRTEGDENAELLSPRDEQSTNARISHCTNILNQVFACLQHYSSQKEFTPSLLQLGIVREVKFALKRLQYCHDAVRIILNLCMFDNFTTTKLAFDEPNFFRVIIDCAVESFDTKTGSFFLLKIIDQILCGFSSHKLSQNLTTKFRIHEYKLVRAHIMHEIRVFFVHHYLETRLLTYEILHKVGCLESPLTKTIHRQLKKQENSLCKFLARSVSPKHIVTTRALLLLFSTPGINLKDWIKFDHPLFNLNQPYVSHFAVCDACGVFHSEEKQLRLCSECNARMYCSKRCQEMHYNIHRKYCNPSRKPEYEKWVILVKDHTTKLGYLHGSSK